MAYVPGGMAALAKEQAKEGGSGVHTTVNITAIKGFHIRELISSVTAGTWKRTLQQIFAYCASRGSAADDEIGPNDALSPPGSLMPRNALQAAAAQAHSGFHALRYSIAQCTASVVSGEKGNNYEERVRLLGGLIGAACDCDNVVSAVADMFSFVPHSVEVTVDSVNNLLDKQLRLPVAQQWAVAIGLMYSSREANINVGRKLIEAKSLTDISALSLNLEIALRSLILTDPLLCSSTTAKEVLNKLHSSVIDVPHEMPSHFSSASVADAYNTTLNSISIGGLIEDLGPASVATHADCATLLATFPAITPKLVAEGMAVLARPSLFASSRDTNAYNSFRASLQKSNLPSVPSSAGLAANPDRVTEFLLNFVGTVKEKVPRLDWHAVLAALDAPGIVVENFAAIAKGYTRGTDSKLPLDVFYGKWRNTGVQAKALLYVLAHPELVEFPRLATGKHAPKHRALPPTITSTNPALAPWATVDFFEAICHVSSRERGVADAVKKITGDAPAQLFVGFLLSQPQGSLAHLTFAFHALRTHGAGACLNEAGVAHLTTESRLGALTGLLGQLVVAEPSSFVEIVEVVMSRKLSGAILSSKGVTKLVAGVVIAGAGVVADIPAGWLESHIPNVEGTRTNEDGNPFEIAAAALDVCDEFLSRQKFTKNAASALKILGGPGVKAVLPAIATHATALLESGDSSFPPEVEEAARARVKEFIQRPSRVVPIDEVEQLARSTDPASRQLFACIVSVLLEDVMNIVPISFTTMSLAGQLYGGLIGRKLLDDKRTVPALQFVLTCISKEKDARTNEFGIKALEAFYHRLSEWPHYGKQLKAVEHIYLDMRIPGIMAVIRSAKRSSKAAAAAAANANAPVVEGEAVADTPAQEGASEANRLHQHDISMLLGTAKIITPPSTVCDEINFLVGNTDPDNLHVNAASIRDLLKPEYLDYFADYLVVKRVSLEPNNHNLYLDMLKNIANDDLDATVRKATARCVRLILSSETPDSSQRSLLKALGSWFGQMTLARNLPVPARELHFRELIFDALRNGKLLFVVPFVAKVLERCSVPGCVFAPKNPWTMCQLMLLLEIYKLPNVHTNLCFELDILLKAINCSMQELEAFSLSVRMPRNTMRRILNEMDFTKPNPDFRFDEHSSFGTTSPPPGGRGMSRLSSQAAPYQPPIGPPKLPLHPDIVHSKDNVVVAGIERYTTNRVAQFQEALLALIASILTRKVVLDHIERSVTVACNTTKSLVMKDFTLDPDIEAMRKAGVTMVRSLASNHCISFRESLSEEARKVFSMLANKLAKNDALKAQEILEVVHRNNIGLVFRIAESQAAQKSEERFLAEFQEVARAKEAALRTGAFSLTPDQQEYRREIQSIPASLRDPSCVTGQQRRVYDDFANCNPTLELIYSQVKNIEDIAIKLLTKKDQATPIIVVGENSAVEEISDAVRRLCNDVAKETAEYLAPHVLFRLFLVQDKISLADSNNSVSSQVLQVSRYAFLSLLAECKRYVGDGPISAAFVNDDRRWKQIELGKRMVARGLLSHTILDKALIADLQHSERDAEMFAKEILSFIVTANVAAESIVEREFAQVIAFLKRGANSTSYPSSVTSIRLQSVFNYPSEMRDRINGYIDTWTQINQTARKEKSTEFMKELQDNRMLRSGADGHIRELLGTMLEASVEDFCTKLLSVPVPLASILGRSNSSQVTDASLYVKADASTDFVSLLIRCCSSTKDQASSSTLNLLNRMLSIFTEVLRNNHAKCVEMMDNPEAAVEGLPALPAGVAYQTTFNQRPFVRFMSKMMENNLSKRVVPNLNQDSAVRGFLDQLKVLSPLNVPGFAFGWLELVCHRYLTARCLAGESRQYWDDYAGLLVEGLRFVDTFVGANRTATPASMIFFRGLFKLMLVILHDFPIFAHSYCHYLCAHIPHSCIQMRNVVLSAFPYPELPDPFQTKFDESNKREENRNRHEILGPVMACLKDVIDPDVFMKAFREKTTVPGLIQKLRSADGSRSPWNVQVINAVTLAISNASLTLSNEEPNVNIENPAVRQFVEICDTLDDEGRYYFLNACANHLRCPNSHTNFFGHLLLFLFKVDNQRFVIKGENGAEATREQVVRVLAERLTAVRPHPWGLLVVLLELMDNPIYQYNQRLFLHCSPEVSTILKDLQNSILRHNK